MYKKLLLLKNGVDVIRGVSKQKALSSASEVNNKT